MLIGTWRNVSREDEKGYWHSFYISLHCFTSYNEHILLLYLIC